MRLKASELDSLLIFPQNVDRNHLIRCASLVSMEMERFFNHVITGKELKVLRYLSPHRAVFHMRDEKICCFHLSSLSCWHWIAHALWIRQLNGEHMFLSKVIETASSQQQPHHLLNHLSVSVHAKCTAFFALNRTKQGIKTIRIRDRVRPSTYVSINCAVWKMHT